jgi:hypothetical protein
MIPWSGFKALIDNDPNLVFFYTTEALFRSAMHPEHNQDRYYIYTENNGQRTETSITLETPSNADQQDFDNNYKASGILV